MTVKAIVGGQWGDEGKGKIVDQLAADADVVGRGTGSDNAGHTVCVYDRKIVLHYIPSGIVHPHTTNIMGNDMVISTVRLGDEISDIKSKGIDVKNRLFVSDRAHIILPHYMVIEDVLEKTLNIGTTKKGVGPAYMFKTARAGVTFGDIFYEERLKENLKKNIKFSEFFGVEVDLDKLRDELFLDFEKLDKYVKITDTDALLNKYILDGRNVLLEGAQATMLSYKHGTYPHVTPSDPALNGLCSGVGIPASLVDEVILVFKAYPTRVGNGYMPTLMDKETDEKIRAIGGEYGATTGRPRRCGWFDAVAGAYAVRLNRPYTAALTKLDVLDGLPEVHICIAYRLPDGSKITKFPTNSGTFELCTPEYITLQGWDNTKGIKDWRKLPKQAVNYTYKIEELIQAPVNIVTNGPKRNEIIYMS